MGASNLYPTYKYVPIYVNCKEEIHLNKIFVYALELLKVRKLTF